MSQAKSYKGSAPPIKRRVKERPVTFAGIIVGVLMFLATRYLGKEQADALQQWFVLLAPIIAGFITERFTFSKHFISWMIEYLYENPIELSRIDNVRKVDSRVKDPRRYDRPLSDKGASDLVVVALILFGVLVIILLTRGRI